MTHETFVKPAVGAIIRREVGGVPHLLIQERCKRNGGATNGLLELPAGKVRTYESLFDALRREVREETGLTVTQIEGESETAWAGPADFRTLAPSPYCITQNLSGGYSLLLCTFLCEAAGEPLACTDESAHIRWMPADDCRALLYAAPGRFFPMHIHALSKWLGLLPVNS